MAISKVVVIGNRDLSRSIVSALVPEPTIERRPIYQVTVLTYPGQTPYLPSRIAQNVVEHRTSNFSSASLEQVFTGKDIVISTMAGGDYRIQVRIVDAAIAAGVRRFIPHEFGHDSLNKRIQERIPRSLQRARVIGYLRSMSAEHESFEWTAVAVGCTLDSMLSTGNLGFDLQWQTATVYGTGIEKFAASSLKRASMVVAYLLEHWEAVNNRYLYAAGCITSASHILQALERVSGANWSVNLSNVDDCIKEGQSRIERGFPDSGMYLMECSVLYDTSLDAVGSFNFAAQNNTLQLEPEPVDAIVEQAYHAFKHHGRPSCGCR
ncbi:isoflavone reductase family protein [Polyplosphaeria fusca]|uniref:Isoflavone reductase family protein n=1 Tax=Polyplosphaeria fusca TaxID=682080 RepID=A0A9P4R446_9PLEO|nr:isoflavone reductase family protein [Polyplosphaeria fusca]